MENQKTEPLFEFVVRLNHDGSITTTDTINNLDELSKLQMLASIGAQAQHSLDINKAYTVFMENEAEMILTKYLNSLPTVNDIESVVKKVITEMTTPKKPNITKL